jgi:hypothetical protein
MRAGAADGADAERYNCDGNRHPDEQSRDAAGHDCVS